jgi:broad specificity phosphatase PhoE
MLYHIGPCHDYISKYTGANQNLNHVKMAFTLLDSSGGDPVTLSAETTAGLTVVGSGHQDVTEFLNSRFLNHVGPTDIPSLFFVDEEEAKCRDNSDNDIDSSKKPQSQSILILPMKDISGQSLAGLTEEYQKEELVTGDNNLKRCKEKSSITVKRHTITVPDQNRYLIVALNRFVTSGSAGTFKQTKLENHVIAEDLLTVGGVKFTLCGLIHHSGGVTGGHYVYHLKTGAGWTEFNDSRVTPTQIISDNIKNSGYVYLYERVLGSAAAPAVPAQAPIAVPADLTNFLTRKRISVNADWSKLELVQTIPDEIKPYVGINRLFVRAPVEFKGEYEFLQKHGLAFLDGKDMFIHKAAEQLYGDGGAFTNKNAAKYLNLMYKYTLPGRKLALESAKGLAKNTEAGVSVQTQLNEMQGYLKRINVVMKPAFTQAPTQALAETIPALPLPPAPVNTPPAQPLPPAPAPTPPALDPSGQKACNTCTLLNDAGATHCAACGASLEKPSAVIVMRHGVRADNAGNLCDPADIRHAWAVLGKSLGTTNTETERSYDTPLCEYTRPKEAYTDISDRFAQITRIVTSPFVRCVQTAAAIAAQLPNVPEIFVNRNLGEKYSAALSYGKQFQELTSDQLEMVFKQAYKAAGSKEFKGQVRLRGKPVWDISGEDRAWFTMLDTEIKKEISQKGDGTLLLITHGDVAILINNHDKDFEITATTGFWGPDYCGYYTNISDPTKPEFSTEWKAGKFIDSAAVGQPINK